MPSTFISMKISVDSNKLLQIAVALEAERAVAECNREETKQDYVIPLPSPENACGGDELELSILLPVWNPDKGQFLRCLRALKSSRLEGISHEFLVSDNASTSEVVRQCLDEVGLANVRYVKQASNIGGFPNFNYCLANSRGRWLHLLSHDDWVEPDFYVSLLRGQAEKSGTDLRFCRCRLFYESSNTMHLMFDEASDEGVLVDFLDRQAPCQRIQLVSALFSRRTIVEIGGFNTSLGAGADWEYWTRVASRFTVYYHPGQFATYVLHEASWSQREGNFEDAESFRKFRRILVRILLCVPREKRRTAAAGFMLNMLQRLLGVAQRNKKLRQLPQNRPLVESLLPATCDAGLSQEIQFVLASLT